KTHICLEVINMSRKIVFPYIEKLYKRYQSGTAAYILGKEFQTSGEVVRRAFRKAGYTVRDRSEAAVTRQSKLTPKQRRKLTQKAFTAVIGRKRSVEERSKAAITREQ